MFFADCARNCSTYFPNTVQNIRLYSKLFNESYILIVKNRSTDKTKDIIHQNLNDDDIFLHRKELIKLLNRGFEEIIIFPQVAINFISKDKFLIKIINSLKLTLIKLQTLYPTSYMLSYEKNNSNYNY